MSVADILVSEVARSISRRAGRFSSNEREAIFSKRVLTDRVWVWDTYAVVLIGDKVAVDDAIRREKRFADPFPRLVTTRHGERAMFSVAAQQNVFARLTMDSGPVHAIHLGPDSSVYLNDVAIVNILAKYTVPNVYLLGFGTSITPHNYADYFDDLLAKQISMARGHDKR